MCCPHRIEDLETEMHFVHYVCPKCVEKKMYDTVCKSNAILVNVIGGRQTFV